MRNWRPCGSSASPTSPCRAATCCCRTTPMASSRRSVSRGRTRRGRAGASTPGSLNSPRPRPPLEAASAPWRTRCGWPSRRRTSACRRRRSARRWRGRRSCRKRSRDSRYPGPPISPIAEISRACSTPNARCSTRGSTSAAPSPTSRRRLQISNAPSAPSCPRAPRSSPCHLKVADMKRTLLVVLIVVAGAVAVGLGMRWMNARRQPVEADMSAHTAETQAPTPMAATTPRGDVTVDPRRQQLIGVKTVAATKTTVTPTIRTVGSVRSAETRLADVNVKLDGWIRELFVAYTGQAVTKGQPLFTLYSPDLLAAENEYVLALKAREGMQQSQIAEAKGRADQLVAAARQRLALWDLTDEQLRTLDQRREASSTVTFRSPVDGVVMEKTAVKGMHITSGQMLYKIADLSTVWVEADVYENELPLVRVGDRATVTLEAYPGELFTGRVIYIYPYVDENTRTNKVRYEFANGRGHLKPGMFANVEIAAPTSPAVVVPLNALLDSGKEQIVFVSQGDGYFEPRNVKAC